MVPATSEDIDAEYKILLNELRQYNPDMLDKSRLLAITKCDTVEDEELDKLRNKVPDGIPAVFISSVSGYNIQVLKDMLWDVLQQDNQ